MSKLGEALLAWYPLNEQEQAGIDRSGHGNDARPAGQQLPKIKDIHGRKAAWFGGGANGSSYLELPASLLENVSDNTGLTVAAWVNFGMGVSIWERIFDFGSGEGKPSLFLTRQMRGTLAADGDLAVDPGKGYVRDEWMHVAFAIKGTEGGTQSSAGPIVYVNGEIAVDGTISQTSSGNYAKLRSWFASFGQSEHYQSNYIGRSQFAADDDYTGAVTDFRVYKAGLSADEVIEVMCDSLGDDEVIRLARDKYLSAPATIVTKPLHLPTELMGGRVTVAWTSSQPAVLSHTGELLDVQSPQGVQLSATLTRGEHVLEKSFDVSVLPSDLPPYTLTVHGDRELLDVSEVMYGLFYEDINNAADGGIYAEMVQNRSFESFAFDTYSHASGACGCSTGRNREPLFAWYGETDKLTVQHTGGLNAHFGVDDPDVNAYYVTATDGTTIVNRGFNDTNGGCAMNIREGAGYTFTIWAKAEQDAEITLQLQTPDGQAASEPVHIAITGNGAWRKYGVDTPIVLHGSTTVLGQLALTFNGDVSIDMVSLVPQDVWGADEENNSPSAHANYTGNPNYRLRRDLVEALQNMKPSFLRFPGGCISEGSFIWDNVYDWKDSIGDIELRKENFNVWGYMMTMGLGYMEYFQLAEDLNAVPLPVMACGVLCQARSDYAHPAGGALREHYIKNFTDLIDFAISTDFDHNEWAAMRRHMGHEAPFDLRYLGVGNENWGTEFFANFEVFKRDIEAYVAAHYPGHELYIISTVGAQADDDAYQQGWKFLSGNLEGGAEVEFADGQHVIQEHITWYADQPDYMDTIADEHYYRSNEYLLNNADRYNYYHRAQHPDGSIDWRNTSKVFVGEYASTDKNTLAGAVAEAAVMTGFENNADVVRLAAYAPLFNKVLTDGTYRWTPDCIWFDDETVWYTPNYYVQHLFATYLGDKVLGTSFSTYKNGRSLELIPRGGIKIATGQAEIVVKKVTVTSNTDGAVLLEQDFTTATELLPEWQIIPGSAGHRLEQGTGLILSAQDSGLNGLYVQNDNWTDYRVDVVAIRTSGTDGFYIGAGLTDIRPDTKDVLEYAIGYGGNATGVKVYKQGIEGYTLGDYSSSTAAGNLRAASYEPLSDDTEYTITVNYGDGTGNRLICSYTDGTFHSKVLDYKLEAYNREVFHSVTKDNQHVYIKLVNADAASKATRLQLNNLTVDPSARWLTLTGDESLLHTPNVNTKNAEQIIPTEQPLTLDGSTVTLNLPPSSVNVLVLSIRE
ncbi:alpha-L-arabinofuranosidase C-terminal domain-containing protein [Paenibacillus sp. WLX1005]|uniref:alpha-L-arabinofuranosidase C-terminal domain-containing protein n=1 Tax=Paenibacillus sp. WLX1005 TaxID=3243766 RepID=UPI0039845AA1